MSNFHTLEVVNHGSETQLKLLRRVKIKKIFQAAPWDETFSILLILKI